jgi:uncharacterized cupin superfamily protein
MNSNNFDYNVWKNGKMTKFKKKQPTEEELNTMGVYNWDIWTKEISSFPWKYDNKEIFYVLEGEAEIVFGNEKFSFKEGDLVTCDAGVKCTWNVKRPIKKHYKFED